MKIVDVPSSSIFLYFTAKEVMSLSDVNPVGGNILVGRDWTPSHWWPGTNIASHKARLASVEVLKRCVGVDGWGLLVVWRWWLWCWMSTGNNPSWLYLTILWLLDLSLLSSVKSLAVYRFPVEIMSISFILHLNFSMSIFCSFSSWKIYLYLLGCFFQKTKLNVLLCCSLYLLQCPNNVSPTYFVFTFVLQYLITLENELDISSVLFPYLFFSTPSL